MTVAILANFPSGGLVDPLRAAFSEAKLSIQIEIHPVDQIIQGLLAASAGSNVDFFVILIRPFLGRAIDTEAGACRTHVYLEFLRNALLNAAVGVRGRILVVICPEQAQSHLDADALRTHFSAAAASIDLTTEEQIFAIASPFNREDLFFPSVSMEPSQYSDIGHVVIATMIARRVYHFCCRPKKLIVVDCDNTLWRGVAGDDGPDRLQFEEGRLDFHRFLLGQVLFGRLLCLCSKSSEENIFKVIDTNAACLIKRENIAAWRINWQPKPTNVISLCAELNLDLDSVIFVDDSALECEMMNALCPAVTVVRVPELAEEVMSVIRGVWDFDTRSRTSEDIVRTRFYIEARERETFRSSLGSVEEFVKQLEVKVVFSPLTRDDLARAAQLLDRVNQFNLNGLRKTEGQMLRQMEADSVLQWLVRVTDRFGDYGFVGYLSITITGVSVVVDSLVLSCRALGRGVEQNILEQLQLMAHEQGNGHLSFRFRDTGRNGVIGNFLTKVNARVCA